MVAGEEMSPRPLKAASAAADVLRRRIISGDLAVGDQLPTEMQLVHELGISRPTVRAALRILENEQLITVRRGRFGGAWINPPTTRELARRAGIYLQFHGVTLDEVHRARAAIEPPAARIVAAAGDPAAIARLTAIADDEQRSIADRAAFRCAALGFHQAVVELAGNHTLVVLSAMIHEVIEHHVVRYQMATGPDRRGAARHDEHRRFVDLVESRDADAAERMWAEHLEAGRQLMLREAGVDSVVELLHAVGP